MVYKRIVLVLCFINLIFGCTQKKAELDIAHKKAHIDKFFQIDYISKFTAFLPLKEKIAQLFIVGIDGKEFSEKTKNYYTQYAPGAFLFFGYNIASNPQTVINFTHSIQNYFVNELDTIPPLLIIDHEGGYVNRLRSVASALPSAQAVTEQFLPQQAEELYYNAGLQLKSLGFNVNLSPVAESENEKNRIFLDTRSYGSKKNVQLYASAAIRGYKKAGILTVAKHFPANTDEDPHFGLPHLAVSKTTLKNEYVIPFTNVLFAQPDAVLMSHIILNALDSNTPACLSKNAVTELLKNQAGFSGVIFSDDLYMGALTHHGFPPEKAVIAAIDAGVHMLMVSVKDFSAVQNVLYQKALSDPLFLYKIELSVSHVIRLKIKANLITVKNNKIIALPLKNPESQLQDFFAAFKALQNTP